MLPATTYFAVNPPATPTHREFVVRGNNSVTPRSHPPVQPDTGFGRGTGRTASRSRGAPTPASREAGPAPANPAGPPAGPAGPADRSPLPPVPDPPTPAVDLEQKGTSHGVS